MIRILPVARFEVECQLRRPATLTLLPLLVDAAGSVSADGRA